MTKTSWLGTRGRLRTVALVIAAVPPAALGVLFASGVLAGDNDTSPVPAKLAAAPAAPTYASIEEECTAIATAKADYVTRVDQFLAEFIASGQSIDGLRRASFTAMWGPMPYDVAGLLERAEGGVVVGKVVEQRVERAGYFVSLLSVSESLKGAHAPATLLTLVQEGGRSQPATPRNRLWSARPRSAPSFTGAGTTSCSWGRRAIPTTASTTASTA